MRARPPAQRRQPRQHVRHDSSGASAATPSGMRLTIAAAAPAQRLGDEVMPVARRGQRHEQIARRSVRLSMETPVAAQSPTARPPVAAPPRPRSRALIPPVPVQRRHRDAGLFGIVEGIDRVADDLPGLVALAGDQQRVARPSASTAAQDRLGPVADLVRLGAGGQDRGADRGRVLAARVVVGDIDDIGVPPPRAPISGRLPRSRSPPAPKTTTAGPSHAGAAPQRGGQRIGRMGVIDEDRRAVRARRGASCIRPRTVSSRGSAAKTAAGSRPGGDAPGPRPPARSRPGSRRSAPAAPARRALPGKAQDPGPSARTAAPSCADRRASARPTPIRRWPAAAAIAASRGPRVVEVDHRRPRPRGSTRANSPPWRRNRLEAVRDSPDGPG
jgi:hypothetical protein